jgi:hypothetical protein
LDPDKNIMVGTPAYNGMVHTDYVHSLLSFGRIGIKFGFLSIGGESLITRARNSILARFYHTPEFSYLLFLDGDVYLQGEDLKKMIDAERDVIGAAVPLKTREDGNRYSISAEIAARKATCSRSRGWGLQQ